MPKYAVYPNTDLALETPVGELTISPDGAVQTSADATPQGAQLRETVDQISAEKTLRARVENPAGSGSEAQVAMTILEVAKGDPHYPGAVISALASRQGFRCRLLAGDDAEADGWE